MIKSRAGSVEREILPVRGGLQGWMNQCAVSHAQKMSSLIICYTLKLCDASSDRQVIVLKGVSKKILHTLSI